jgi:hypothetical protein
MIFLDLIGIETRVPIFLFTGITEVSSTFLDMRLSISNGTNITAKADNVAAYIMYDFTAPLINNTPG